MYVEVLLLLCGFEWVLVCVCSGGLVFVVELSEVYGFVVEVVDVVMVVLVGDVIVICICVIELLFDGCLVKLGVFVVVVGFSKLVVCELDDVFFDCVVLIVVEWLLVVEGEVGEFKCVVFGVIWLECVVELGVLLNKLCLCVVGDIIVYKSVGIGLEDVVLV